MAEYGLPYRGSKDEIAESIIKIFPKADNFYDLFGGGFSITHCILERRYKDYKEFHFNEIRPGICDLIKDAIAGKYNYNVFKPKFIEREEFLAKKESDAYIKICWSFGNNGENYLFGKEIEGYKRSLHNAVAFNEFDDLAKKVLGIDSFFDNQSIKDRRLFVRQKVSSHNKLNAKLKRGDLQQLERLERLERLEQLHFYNTDYRQVPIKANSIIYCDIPYKGTGGYGREFSHDEFFHWAHLQEHPVFISEYEVKDSRFKQVFQIKKRALMSSQGSTDLKNEKIYVNQAGFKKMMQHIK